LSSIKKRLFIASASGIAGFGIKTVLNLVFIPFVIAYLGSEQYGAYILLISTTEMCTWLSHGALKSLTLRLGEALHSNNKLQQVNSCLLVGFWAHILIAALVLSIGFAALPFVQQVINWPNSLKPQVAMLFIIAVAEGCIIVISGFYRAVLNAHTRFGIANMADIVQAVLTNGFSLLLLTWQTDLITIMLARLVISTLSTTYFAWVSRQEWLTPQMTYRPTLIKPDTLSSFNQVCFPSTLQSICGIFANRSDGFIISSALNMQALAAYSIILRVFGQVIFLSAKMSEGIFPIMTRLLAQQETAKLEQLFIRSSQILLFSAF
jgi:O-antigen/teichoic acid export membrane protein